MKRSDVLAFISAMPSEALSEAAICHRQAASALAKESSRRQSWAKLMDRELKRRARNEKGN